MLCKWHAMELGLPDGTTLPFTSEAEFAQALITQINTHKKSVQLVTIFSDPQAPVFRPEIGPLAVQSGFSVH